MHSLGRSVLKRLLPAGPIAAPEDRHPHVATKTNRDHRRSGQALLDEVEAKRFSAISHLRPRITAVLFISEVNAPTVRALAWSRSFSPDDLHVVNIASDLAEQNRLRQTWTELGLGVILRPIHSPAGDVVRLAVQYVQSLRPAADHTVIVVIPELAAVHWYEHLLHNQKAPRLE